MHRRDLLQLLARHRTRFMDEAAYVAQARSFILAHEDCFHRSLLHGHVTGSAWVVNPSHDAALLLHHRKHNQWFQPGGHADGDHDVLRVALKETCEETGIAAEHIKLVSSELFDVDIHTIPALPEAPRHRHYDLRFLLEIDDHLEIPGNDESHQILWVPLDQVARFNNNRSTLRMAQKTRDRVHQQAQSRFA
ncbi:MAG: NUDIX hydrolase [Gammaproteobacteria bacterium]